VPWLHPPCTQSASLNTYMADFAQNYGTHFINLGIAGAIANVFLQTSASSQAQLQQNSVSFSTNAQVRVWAP
jgi:hypothetical protein